MAAVARGRPLPHPPCVEVPLCAGLRRVWCVGWGPDLLPGLLAVSGVPPGCRGGRGCGRSACCWLRALLHALTQQERRLEPHAGLPGAAQLARAQPGRVPCQAGVNICEAPGSSPPLAPAVQAVWSAGRGPSCPVPGPLAGACAGSRSVPPLLRRNVSKPCWVTSEPGVPAPDPSLTICKHQPSDGRLTHLGSILGRGRDGTPPHTPPPEGSRHPTDQAWGSVLLPHPPHRAPL